MELPRRTKDDVYLPDGALRNAIERLRCARHAHELRIGIAYAFDFRTHMLPYWYADKRMSPCSVRMLGDVLNACGFSHVRIVVQQWTPNFRPRLAEIDGKPLDILMVSAMQVHAEPAYELIRDAHRLGDDRPLILAGGPKAIYEPTDYLEIGPEPGVGADCVMTGEAFVLVDFLERLLASPAASPRAQFEDVRTSGALKDVPGLVYLSPDATPRRPVAINTGVQHLLRDLDEIPMPDAGFRMLERPHRGQRLSKTPLPAHKIAKHSAISSVVTTMGCKFSCSYCPIPAYNQRTWRFKSPKRIAAEIKHIYETFGIVDYFSTDDNFFNTRDTVIELMTEMANTESGGKPLGEQIRFFTEATEFDVHKNRDLLPLCRRAGLSAIWFGIEDITAKLVNKGQTEGKTEDVFKLLRGHDIEPMVMMIHSDDQPLRSRHGDLSGLLNQARYVFDQGAVTYQCTYLAPAVGTKDFEPAAESRSIYRLVGGKIVPQAYQDGNHVVSSQSETPWERQMNVVRAYAHFYNPLNFLRVLVRGRRYGLLGKRLLFQVVGMIGIVLTYPRLLSWARRLKRGPIEVWDGLQRARIPMVSAETGEEMNWAIKHLPSLDEPVSPEPLPVIEELPRVPALVSLPILAAAAAV